MGSIPAWDTHQEPLNARRLCAAFPHFLSCTSWPRQIPYFRQIRQTRRPGNSGDRGKAAKDRRFSLPT